jgi:hypothetical protein
MSRRGQCRCGAVLDFVSGPQGYKMRCPMCGAVVRLRADASTSHDGPRQRKRSGALAFLAPGPADPGTGPSPPLPPEQFDFGLLEPGELPVVEMVPLSELQAANPGSFWRRRWLPLAAAVVVTLAGALVIALLRG